MPESVNLVVSLFKNISLVKNVTATTTTTSTSLRILTEIVRREPIAPGTHGGPVATSCCASHARIRARLNAVNDAGAGYLGYNAPRLPTPIQLPSLMDEAIAPGSTDAGPVNGVAFPGTARPINGVAFLSPRSNVVRTSSLRLACVHHSSSEVRECVRLLLLAPACLHPCCLAFGAKGACP